MKGSRSFFLLCMLCAALSAFADMITPQIIRVTVDQVILGEPTDSLNPMVFRALEALGGAEKVTAVDVSETALDTARENARRV